MDRLSEAWDHTEMDYLNTQKQKQLGELIAVAVFKGGIALMLLNFAILAITAAIGAT